MVGMYCQGIPGSYNGEYNAVGSIISRGSNLDRHLSFGVPLDGCSLDKSNDARRGRLSREPSPSQTLSLRRIPSVMGYQKNKARCKE
jgi:hypothetical protein